MTPVVTTTNLTCTYGKAVAVDDLSVTVPAGTLCGLLGRNGSGKSTLMSTIAAFRRPTSGSVMIDGEEPYENERAMGRTCLIRESGDIEDDLKISDVMWFAGQMRARWDEEYAHHLLDRFELTESDKVKNLSLGQRSALGSTLGLATRAPLTMFDESYLGMDAVSRRVFYDELLSDYLRTPRTIIVSTHLIGEIAPLLERVIVLEHGRLTLSEDTETLRGRATAVTGPAEVVDRIVSGTTVLNERSLGGTKQVTVYGDLGVEGRAAAQQAGVELGPVPLQDLLVHLTDLGDERIPEATAARTTTSRNGDHP